MSNLVMSSSVDEVLDLSTQKTFGKNRISARTVTIPSPQQVPAFQAITEDIERHYGEMLAESQKMFPLGIPWSEKVQERHTRIVNAFLSPYGSFGSIFFPPRFQEDLCLDLSKPSRTRSATPDDTEGQRAADKEKQNTFRFASTGKIRRRKRKATGETNRHQKSLRKLLFEDESTPPVSGTIIVGPDDTACQNQASADIDPALNLVEVTEEARAELARIENKIGDYICRLCKLHYNDAFALAQHRCSRIVHLSYVCSECDKVFNCPANLASHRRWHQPRGAADKAQNSGERKQKAPKADLLSDSQNNNAPLGLSNGLQGDYRPHAYTCWRCFKTFSLLLDLHRHNCSFGDFSAVDQKFLPLVKRIEI